MQIQSGKLYENRTWKYIYPCLKYYGTTLMGYLHSFYKLGVGVKDHNVEIEGNCIYILIDTKVHLEGTPVDAYRQNLSKFLEWVKYQHFYVSDYVFEGLDINEKHIVVIRVPEEHNRTYARFLKGKYSEMYTKEEIAKYFAFVNINNKDLEKKINEKLQMVRATLNKNSNYLPKFLEELNNEFNTNLSLEEIRNHELDFPPVQEEEIFNYKKTITNEPRRQIQ